jgi:hypothetical protein
LQRHFCAGSGAFNALPKSPSVSAAEDWAMTAIPKVSDFPAL